MNIFKILFLLFFLIPFSKSLAQNQDIIFENVDVITGHDTPSTASKDTCKTCKDYSIISDFEHGIRAVKNKRGKIGFINKQGTLIIPLEYQSYHRIYENHIVVSRSDSKQGVIDYKNNSIIPFAYSSIYKWSNNVYKVKKDNKMGVLDMEGKEIIPVEYESMVLQDGFYVVNRNGNFGILDINGNILLEPIYKSIKGFEHNFFLCQAPNNSNIFDVVNNQKFLKGNYNNLVISRKDLFLVSKEKKVGLINFSEDILIPIIYDEIQVFDNNFYLVIKNGKYGVYDIFRGKEIIPTKYERIRNIIECYELKKEGKYGLAYPFKNKYKIVLPIEYEHIYNMGAGKLRLTKNNKKGIFDVFSKKMVVPVIYDKIENTYYSKTKFYLAHIGQRITILSGFNFKPIVDKEFDNVLYKNGLFICTQNSRYDVYGGTGYTYLEQVEDLVVLNNTFLKVKKGNKWGMYSIVLKDFIVPCEHDKLYLDYARNLFKIGDESYKIIGNKLIKQ